MQNVRAEGPKKQETAAEFSAFRASLRVLIAGPAAVNDFPCEAFQLRHRDGGSSREPIVSISKRRAGRNGGPRDSNHRYVSLGVHTANTTRA
jgi:hypothetical protein